MRFILIYIIQVNLYVKYLHKSFQRRLESISPSITKESSKKGKVFFDKYSFCRFVLNAVILILLCSSCTHDPQEEADKAYNGGNFREAADLYMRLAHKDSVQSEQLLRAKQLFNAGCAIFRQSDFDSSALQFSMTAAQFKDSLFRADSYYNLGNSLFFSGEKIDSNSKNGNQSVPADRSSFDKYKSAAAAYIDALKVNPRDSNSRYNLAYVNEKLRQLQNSGKGGSNENSGDNGNSNEGNDSNKGNNSNKDKSGAEKSNNQNKQDKQGNNKQDDKNQTGKDKNGKSQDKNGQNGQSKQNGKNDNGQNNHEADASQNQSNNNMMQMQPSKQTGKESYSHKLSKQDAELLLKVLAGEEKKMKKRNIKKGTGKSMGSGKPW